MVINRGTRSMTNTKNSQTHIFLVQPLNKHIYKEMIVYSDSEQNARKAAALAENPKKVPNTTNEFSAETVYLDRGMSICIEIEPVLVKLENKTDCVRVQYNEVMYDLKKNSAQEVIAENIY
jgi:hypothetical protein